MSNKINKKMSFSEIIEKHPETAEFLMEKGMHCIGCPMAQMTLKGFVEKALKTKIPEVKKVIT